MAIRTRRPGSTHSLAAPAVIAGLAGVILLGPAAGSVARPIVTGSGRLGVLASENLVSRADLLPGPAVTEAGPVPVRRLLTLVQLSDIHLVDEGSPLRTEFLDAWMGTAYRPQEGLTPHVLERMTAAVRSARSPMTGHAPELVITTGDNTDTGQLNEVRWFIDLLDGGRIDPDSGVPGTCDTDPEGPRSVAWSGEGRGYDPEPMPAIAGRSDINVGGIPGDGPGYAAEAGRNLASVGRGSTLPDHAGLAAAMNRPFEAGGLQLPWYASFGNHDALVQGNAPIEPHLAALASGCAKFMGFPTDVLADIGAAASSGGRDAMLELAFGEMSELSARPADGQLVRRVAADPARIPLSKHAFIEEHFRTTGTPVGHGFDDRNVRSGEGWYALEPVPGVWLLALDTVNEAGGHQGNLDGGQLAWLHEQLLAADDAGAVVIAFGHHSLESMVQPAQGAHLGGVVDGIPTSCPTDAPRDPVQSEEPVRCVLLRHPSFVALVDGHEHRNRITPHVRQSGASAPGGFWEITTASHIEWPQEARLIELVQTTDGLAIVTAMIGHASPEDIASDAPLDSVETLASVARRLSFGDPQARNGRDGTFDPSGGPLDRDTILLLPMQAR